MKRVAAPMASSRLPADERGAALLEFALLAPFLGLLLIGMIDLGRGILAKYAVNQAAIRTVEKAYVGTVRTDYSFLQAEGATAAGVASSAVTVDAWEECDGVRQASIDTACDASQMTARYVSVVIAGTYRPMFNYGPLGSSFGLRQANGTVPVTGRATLRVQ